MTYTTTSKPAIIRLKLRYLPVLFLFGVSIIVLGFFGQELSRLHDQGIKESFTADTNRISTMVNERMVAYSQILRSGAAFFAGSNTVERDEWHAFVEKLDIEQNYKGIQGVGFSLVVPKKKLREHINAIRSQGFPDYIVKPEGDREIYTSIIYLEPFSGRNLRAFGYDMFSETTRNDAMSRACDIGDVAFSGKVKLLQETKKDVQAGLLAYFPVFKNGVIAQTPEQRRDALVGWVYSPYRMKDLLDAIASDSLVMTRLEVFDGDNVSTDNLLYDSQAEHPELIAKEDYVISSVQKIELGGRYWTMRYTTLPGYEVTHHLQPLWIQSLGLAIIGLLLFVLSWLLINTRKSAESIAYQLNEQNRALFMDSPDAYFIMALEGGRISDCNLAAEKMLRGKREEIIGLTPDRVSPLYQSDGRTSLASVSEKIEKALATGYNRFEWKHRRLDGEDFWVDVAISVISYQDRKALLVAWRDISDTKQQEQALQQILRIINESPDYIGTADMSGNLLFHNITARRMIGLDDDADLTTRRIIDMHPAWASKKVLEEGIPTVLKHGFWRGETAVLNKNGNEIPVSQILLLHRDEVGNPQMLSTIMRDITEQKQYLLQVEQGKQIAEELARSKSEFLANMSHEIRTPMNGIIGLSKLALDKEVSVEVRDYLEKINASSESLLGILNDILDFSKLEAGKFSIDYKRFDLEEVLDNLNSLFSHRAAEKLLAFDIDIAEDTCTDLIGDALRLQQILANLVGNAIKFTEQGSVRIQIRPMQRQGSSAQIEFSVTDTGIGITEEDQQKLFQPFTQVETSATRRFGGTGLGLAITKQLLELMGSKLSIESTPGQGSTFRFVLPVALASEQLHHLIDRGNEGRSAGALSADLRQKGRGLSGTRILVAEDNKINQQVVLEFLKLSDVHVSIANHGQEVLDYLKIQNFDAILMDVHMPGMGGVEATKIIRGNSQYTHLPIIALTAGVTEDERDNCLKAGMNDFLPKPVNPEQMIAVLCRWVQKHNRPDAAADLPPYLDRNANQSEPQDGQADCSQGAIWPDINGIDSQQAQFLLADNLELFIELLALFAAENAELVGRLKSHLTKNEWPEAAQIAHKLKGQIVNLGAKELTNQLAALEIALKTPLPAIADLFDRVIDGNDQLLVAVNCWLNTHNPG